MHKAETARRRSMAVAAFGTVVEWYDFSIFFYTSLYLAQAFYAPYEGSFLLALATGAVGFLFRPLGAMVFGHYGDKIGRRGALVISAGIMAIAMFGIALLPTHETLGVWAAILVLLLRSLAGFSVGAEYTGITVFLMESARDGRRGFAASWAAANSEIGALLAVGLSTWLAFALPAEQMQEWGWRVLFLIGGVLAASMIPLRKLMVETESFTRSHQQQTAPQHRRSPLLLALRKQPRAILVAFLISTVGSATYFLNITYVPTYLEAATELAAGQTLLFGTVAALIAIVVTPFIGLAADHFGRRKVFAVLLATVVGGSLPAYLLLQGVSGSAVVFGVALLAIPAAGWSAVASAAVPEQFTAVGRYSGMAIGYNIAVALFGGFSPVIVTWLMQQTGNNLAPAYYAAALCTLAGIPALLLMRNMARKTLAEVDAPLN
ncbi:MFS transporter [Canibacter oris]|uniref:MHS family proline/betaine transporter-like MFS transporter n=1 Tax=Canibacter oris TaxID=1365628 RepID=A0A840DI27_9MICO|nr:MFS transporter [Canibacter oris]MBB4071373.1 MHS family proline/betaine transporter-like MFS transporter [Canibacter oris]